MVLTKHERETLARECIVKDEFDRQEYDFLHNQSETLQELAGKEEIRRDLLGDVFSSLSKFEPLLKEQSQVAANRQAAHGAVQSLLDCPEYRELHALTQGNQLNSVVGTTEIAGRGAVFTHPGRCYRSGISYHAALGRYLWCQVIPGGDTRFEGGLGIYDAPEPWGPWTTVYFTERWDVGPGETASFPTKWTSKDGKTLYLVFSGNDCFSVRKATLAVAGY